MTFVQPTTMFFLLFTAMSNPPLRASIQMPMRVMADPMPVRIVPAFWMARVGSGWHPTTGNLSAWRPVANSIPTP